MNLKYCERTILYCLNNCIPLPIMRCKSQQKSQYFQFYLPVWRPVVSAMAIARLAPSRWRLPCTIQSPDKFGLIKLKLTLQKGARRQLRTNSSVRPRLPPAATSGKQWRERGAAQKQCRCVRQPAGSLEKTRVLIRSF